MPAFWQPYFAVEDCDKTVATAQSLGATICAPAFDVPNVGRMAVLSDPQGALRIEARRATGLQRYRQGSRQAEFLLCGNCGVLVAVVARSPDGRLLGAVNRNAFDQRDGFAPEATVSPRMLAADAKLERWTHLWTPTELADDA